MFIGLVLFVDVIRAIALLQGGINTGLRHQSHIPIQ